MKTHCLITLTITFIISTTYLHCQKQVKISSADFSQWKTIPPTAQKALQTAEKQFKKGDIWYDEALKNYQLIYTYQPTSSKLNYKIGLCTLNGNQPQQALPFLLQVQPTIAKDYLWNLARTYHFRNEFETAINTYEQYRNTLKPRQKKTQKSAIDRAIAECQKGELAMKDSTPAFIINPGELVNSPFDDYGAIETSENDSAVYFTSRRPANALDKKAAHNMNPERVWSLSHGLCNSSGQVTLPQSLKSSQHIAVAGYASTSHQLYYYKGKRQHGIIFSTTITGKDYKKTKPARGCVKNIAYKETSITTDNQGNTWFITNRLGGEGGKDIWQCKKKGKNHFRHARNMGPMVNTPMDEESVFITPNGNTLYFASEGREGLGGFDIYKMSKDANGKWGQPQNMGYPVNTMANELFYRPTSDSLIALLASDRSGGLGRLDIYQVKTDTRIPFTLTGLVSDSKTKKPLAATVSIYSLVDNKLISSTLQDTLKNGYSINFENIGNYQLMVEALGYHPVKDSVAQALKRHDVIRQDYGLERIKYPITVAGKITDLYTHQPVAGHLIFKIINKNDTIAQTLANAQTGEYNINFDDKINLLAEVSANNYQSSAYKLLLKNSSEPTVDFNITLKPNQVSFYITGTVTDKESGKPIRSKVSIYKRGNAVALSGIANDSISGYYAITHTDPGDYTVEATAEGYFYTSSNINLTTDTISRVVNFALPKVKQGAKVVIENILFNSGKSVLLTKSYPGLDKLVQLLKENSHVKVEISGHTDNVGNAVKNKKLSKDRALAVKNYLIKKGIEAPRMIHEGYGAEQPIAPNDSPEGKAKNRRVEIKILED